MSEFSAAAVQLDRSSPLPLWAQLEAELRRRLDVGEFTERFPTDQELTTIYGVSRHTARHAVDRLNADGIVTRERGRGTRVNESHFEQSLGALYSLFQIVEGRGIEQRSEVIALEKVADEDAAIRLGLSPKAPLVHLSRIRLADDEPLAIDNVWLPHDIAGPLLKSDFTHTALYEELDRISGCRPTQGSERIRPVVPSPHERKLLGLPAGVAAFSLERLSSDGTRPIEWRVTLIRGDRFSFLADWSAGQSAGLRLASDEA
ncbi:MAG: GntR family transcriptional regulator [Acidimicrobiales bacterium]